jgi:SAM-dependent methyltransferase
MKPEVAKQLIEKTKEDYEKIAESFATFRGRLWPELEKFGQYVKDGDTILDLGCGNGRLYELFKARPVKYVGVDSCPRLIEIAKEKYQSDSFQLADTLNLPFKEETFDVVFSIALLHHIPSEELRLDAIGEVRRVLKTNATLVFTCWNLYQIDFWPRLLKYTIAKLFGKPATQDSILKARNLDFGDVFIPWRLKSGQTIQRYYHAFSLRELRWLLVRCGFKIIDQYYSARGKRAKWYNGYNIIIIAQKK